MKFLMAAAVLVSIGSATCAHPRLSIDAEAKIMKFRKHGNPIALAGEPKARIRVAADGLGPLDFARWLATNAGVAGSDAARLRRISGPVRLLNRSSEMFDIADRNDDLRVSADELADFITGSEAVVVQRQSI